VSWGRGRQIGERGSGDGDLRSERSRGRRSLRFTDPPRPSRGAVGLVHWVGVEGVNGEKRRFGGAGWSALLRCAGRVECSALELHAYAHVKTEIAVLGQGPTGVGLGILQVIPDERDIQVKMALDLELERGRRMVGI